MTLDELYSLVSLAIHNAESAEAEGDASVAAVIYSDVSHYEEQIAELLPAGDPEGAIARRGAVTAALRAGRPFLASALAGDGASPYTWWVRTSVHVCPTCDGTGSVNYKCPTCEGSGSIDRPSGAKALCPTCTGSGSIAPPGAALRLTPDQSARRA